MHLTFQSTGRLMQPITETDIKRLLEILNASNEMEVHVKIFSIFAVYLISEHEDVRFSYTCDFYLLLPLNILPIKLDYCPLHLFIYVD